MLRTTLRVFFADQEEIVDNSSNRIRCTVNPLLTPLPFGLFISNKFQAGGRGNRDGARIREGGFIYFSEDGGISSP